MKGLLKFITCGSVDDGKSTLIGHMLYDAKLLYVDQENSLVLDSKIGSRDGAIDYSLLLDGLMAEREQGITIDVAYRYFNTDKRSFIVADTPGHEEYTRNMAVGASFANLAVILVDASKGILIQTRRHIRICALMGIRHFVFVVNKMDLISYNAIKFHKIENEIRMLIKQIVFDSVEVIPISATEGDNVTKLSEKMRWYTGKSILEYLEEIDIGKSYKNDIFLMPIQRVSRPNQNFRGFQGEVVQGNLTVGDEIRILPSCETAKVEQILSTDKLVNFVKMKEAATIVFDREVDCSRGCVITKNEELVTSRLFRAELLWMDDSKLVVGRDYTLKVGTKLIAATIIKIHYCINVNTGEHLLQEQAQKNDIINCDVALAEKIVIDSFDNCQELGRFILINRITNMTSACGVIKHVLYRSDNLTWQKLDITKAVRSEQKNQMPKTLWFTGLSGAGKSTIANALEKALVSRGKHTMILDGDNVRMGLNNNLGFNEEDRVENIRRIAEVCKLMNDAGLIVLVAAISPFVKDRENARHIIGEEFYEIYVNTPLEVCEERDVKNLYWKARNGEIKNFTGISSPYEISDKPQMKIDTSKCSVEQAIDMLLKIF